jgi:DNA-binding GntR family transcriptional regulator
MQGDARASRAAMRRHLEESLVRYRRLVDNVAGGTPSAAP